jgi:transposase
MMSEANTSETRAAELESLVARFQAELASSRNELASSRNELASSRNELASSRNELASSRNELASSQTRIAELEKERDILRSSHERLRLELELLKKRLFVAKAERVDTTQLELEFREKQRELERAANTLGLGKSDESNPRGERKQKPTGRRQLRDLPLEEERIEIKDPVLEQLVLEGKVVRHGVDESVSLKRQRGGMRRVIVARVKYRSRDEINDVTGALAVHTAAMPPVMFERCIAAPSLIAHIASRKFCEGMPLFRIEDSFAREGIPLDRGLMSRWLEILGGTLGTSVVHAMRVHALKTAFCIATDATGIAVQPVRSHEKKRKPCKKGYFLVQIADRDHVFFEYLERETSDAIGTLFHGYSGYVQADAKSVFDALFEPPDETEDGCERTEVGCWSHARRKFWEACCAKNAIAREGLARIGRIFELDASWRRKSPAEIRQSRDTHLRPHVDAFFDWVDEEFARVKHERGLLCTALGYAHRQKSALTRFLENGRLVLENNRSERALRAVAVGRKAWLFAGSDDHAVATSHLFTMIASAKLHGLDPEAYLRDMIRVVPHWPRDRYLELAPLFWKNNRLRLDSTELNAEYGPLTIPEPSTTEQQPPR